MEDGATPVQYFFLFFTHRVWQFLVEKTNRYAAHKLPRSRRPPLARVYCLHGSRSLWQKWRHLLEWFSIWELSNSLKSKIIGVQVKQLTLDFSGTLVIQTEKCYNNNVLLITVLGLSLHEIASCRSFACSTSVTLPYPPQHQKVPISNHCSIAYVHISPTITTLAVRSQWMKPWLVSKDVCPSNSM